MYVKVNKAPVAPPPPPATYDLCGISADGIRFLRALIGNQCSPMTAEHYCLPKRSGEGIYDALNKVAL